MSPDVVLFDLDGTLSDSAPGILASLRHAFTENGVPPLDAITERGLLGPPFYESLPPLIGGEEHLPDVIAAYRAHYAAGAMYDTTGYPGVEDVLAALVERGVRLAVATSKPEPYAVPIIERLGLSRYFETVGGDELDGSLRTKALVIDKVLDRLGRPDPATVRMVGDREHDILGARAHGIDGIGVRWGYALPNELEAVDPAAMCADTLDLSAALGMSGV